MSKEYIELLDGMIRIEKMELGIVNGDIKTYKKLFGRSGQELESLHMDDMYEEREQLRREIRGLRNEKLRTRLGRNQYSIEHFEKECEKKLRERLLDMTY